jgi:hypothetical protein
MNANVPHEWMSPERARAVSEGTDVARALITSAFPPHPEDPTGSLASQQVAEKLKTLSQERLRGVPAADRLWWTQGIVLGFCSIAAEQLVVTSQLTEETPLEHLHRLNRRVMAAAAPEKAEAVKDVQRLIEALLERDTVGTAWALEYMFVPARDLHEDNVNKRLRTVLTDAMLTATTTAKIASTLHAQE